METPSNTTSDPVEPPLCRIRNQGEYLIVGKLPDETKMVLRVTFSEFYVVKFDQEGDFLSVERYEVSDVLPEGQDYKRMGRRDKAKAVEQWAANMGFIWGEIYVKEFSGIENSFEIKVGNYAIMVSPLHQALVSAEERLYCILSYEESFLVGKLPDGTQAFISIDTPEVHIAKFDGEGNFLALERYPLTKILPDGQDHWKMEWHEKWVAVNQWAATIGFTEEAIYVKKFTAIENDLELNDIPSDLQELLDSGEELDEDVKESIEYWRYMDYYELICGNDFHMNTEGEVVST